MTIRRTLALLAPLAALLLMAAAPAAPAQPESPTTQPGETMQLPPGHPPMGGGSGALPPGHPTVGGFRHAPRIPSTQPDAKGTLLVEAVQATKDGPQLAGLPVVLSVAVQSDKPIRIEGKLNDMAMAVFKDLPVGKVIQPTAGVIYHGILFKATGRIQTPDNPDQHLKVPVYESTDKAPPWRIVMRHVIIKRTKDGLLVREMFATDNPSDRVWTGVKGADDVTATLDLNLPANTGKVDFFDGFDRQATRLEGRRLRVTAPMAPGEHSYQFAYTVPLTDGSAELAIDCPAPTGQLLVVAPDDFAEVSVPGAEASDPMQMGPQMMRLYTAKDLPAGKSVVVKLTAVKPQPAGAKGAAGGPSLSLPAKAAIVGGGAAVLVGLGLAWFRNSAKSRDADA